jgi:hypothetical protein
LCSLDGLQQGGLCERQQGKPSERHGVSRLVRWQKRLERTGIFGSFVAGQKNNKDFGIVKYIAINKQSKQ